MAARFFLNPTVMKQTIIKTYNPDKKQYETTRIICKNSEEDSLFIKFHFPNSPAHRLIKEDKKIFKQSKPHKDLKSPFFDTVLGVPYSKKSCKS